MTKLIAILPVRNEQWILEKTLATLSLVCDHVFVSDQRSDDRTPQICRAFPKVHYLSNERPYPDPENRRAPLLRAARDVDGSNVVLALDADEILTAQALDPAFRELCESLRPGEPAWLPWIMLWRDARRYRRDRSVWSDRWLPCLFRDDRAADYASGNWHEGRLPVAASDHDRRYDGVRVLHYQFVAYERMLSKQAHCRVLERLQWPDRPSTLINSDYVLTKDERSLGLATVPDEWIAGWRSRGIDLTSIGDESLSWFDREILHAFAQHGTGPFADLDIWDIDWERKRREARARAYPEAPPTPIADPRGPELRLYHAYLNRFMAPPPWRRPAILLAPVRRLLRRAGINRDRLRRFGLLAR